MLVKCAPQRDSSTASALPSPSAVNQLSSAWRALCFPPCSAQRPDDREHCLPLFFSGAQAPQGQRFWRENLPDKQRETRTIYLACRTWHHCWSQSRSWEHFLQVLGFISELRDACTLLLLPSCSLFVAPRLTKQAPICRVNRLFMNQIGV